MVKRAQYVVLDTETTGLDKPAEVCSISIISAGNEVLLNQLVRPTHSIPPSAVRVHGITDERVKNEPSWVDVAPVVKKIIMNKDVIIYNADYDRKIMHWSDEANHMPPQDWKEWSRFYCAMKWYAQVWGERYPRYGSYVWQKLTKAIEQQGLMQLNAHNALADCLMTNALVQHCVERELDKSAPF